jgi:Lrp/AsnC family transcriptional regulator for asnA, asnC and gidA
VDQEQPMPGPRPHRQSQANGDRSNIELINTAPGVLDAPDRKIISLLQQDGRRAYGAIAEEIGLSEAAVRRRVQRLKDSGVMQIVAITDPLQLGYGREALIGIRVHGDVRLVADKIAAIDEANYVVMTAGSFDIIAEVIAEDDNDLVHLLNDAIRSIPGVTEVETFLYLKLAKQTYAWGTK